MQIDSLQSQYWFSGGTIKSFFLDIKSSHIEIDVYVKRFKKNAPRSPVKEHDLEPCTLRILLEDLIEVSLYDTFPTEGDYLDFITFKNGNVIEVGFNVHDGSNFVYEEPNWLIKAKQVSWREV
jgi:hypothetical protein